MSQWYLITSPTAYKQAAARYEALRHSAKGSTEHREKLLLAHLINQYEESRWNIPALDPIELIKIRMEDFGYKPADSVQ
jgi:HTH-type transcriptional regulator / antitoxin HigA